MTVYIHILIECDFIYNMLYSIVIHYYYVYDMLIKWNLSNLDCC